MFIIIICQFKLHCVTVFDTKQTLQLNNTYLQGVFIVTLADETRRVDSTTEIQLLFLQDQYQILKKIHILVMVIISMERFFLYSVSWDKLFHLSSRINPFYLITYKNNTSVCV